jgi:misacylated tRNA(Ala) deacylase
MTELLFRADAYLRECEARIIGVNDRGGILLDRTIFYAAGGGQPGDAGSFEIDGLGEVEIATTVYGDSKVEIVHVPAAPLASVPVIGAPVRCRLDWDRRYGHMRVHTALHLLSAVLTYPVTGGQIGADKGRLDFDIPDATIDKDEVAEKVNAMIAGAHAIRESWITDEELLAKPDLVKTMAVKPPMGTGRVRLIEIIDCDLQPCGGTHVRATGEIGRLALGKIKSKGRQNRRVRINFA